MSYSDIILKRQNHGKRKQMKYRSQGKAVGKENACGYGNSLIYINYISKYPACDTTALQIVYYSFVKCYYWRKLHITVFKNDKLSTCFY